ncbi:MAG: circularly permuted type 2 ATP-grasp protein [Actinomycetota bacterium]|nr:circularly permuted type 2 ATP-grasp protein [Actinomycetota bacterium]
MGSLFDGYHSVAYDEMFARDGAPHPHTKALYDALQLLSSADLEERVSVLDRSLRDQGITFSHAGKEWIFPLDLIPRLIPTAEWNLIEAGVIQRVRALEAFLADIYGPRTVLADGIVPHSLIATSTSYHRAAVGLEPANGVRVHIAGIDLVRDGSGVLRVLEDNLRVPSGISYVVENRRTMARVFPGLFLEQRVQPVAGHVALLLSALRAAAPAGINDPTVVLLTPGVYNSAYFEHAFLARKMGVELVEGRDLFCRDNVLYMRTTSGESRVHVVYRRVDDDYLDPVHFRSESMVGCPGLLNAARAGNVTLANAVGNGVADDKLTYTYVPALIEYYLGERPLLPNVPTYRLGDPAVLEDCLSRLEELVFKPVDGSGGYGLLIGPAATDEELAATRAQVIANPRGWIAQEVIMLSTSPSLDGDRLTARHVDLRPFAINDGDQVRVLPGGLTRVALREGSLVVNSSQGGGSKDTWVLTSRAARSVTAEALAPLAAQAVRASAPDLGPRSEQPQQQQQQGQLPC